MFNRKSLSLAKKLFDRFIQEYNSTRCKDIQTKIMGKSFNLWDEEKKGLLRMQADIKINVQ